MNATRLLIAVSSPWASEKLAEPLVDLARRLEASVVVAHVAQTQEEDDHEADASNRGEQTIRVLTEALDAAGVQSDGVMLFSDDVARAIIKTAEARQCTMIIIGVSGKGPLKRLFEGDVPSDLMRQTELPVLLCPPRWVGMI